MRNFQKLLEKRRELREYINANLIITPMALMLRFPDTLFRKITGYSGNLPIAIRLIVLGLLVTFPTLFAALIFHEFGILAPQEWLGIFIVLEGFCISPVMAHFNVNRLLRKIGTYVVDSVTSVSDLSDLQQWFSLGWTPKILKRYLLCWVILLMPIAIVNMYIVFGEYQSVSLYVWVVTFLVLSGIAWSYAPLAMFLPVRLSRYEYELHEIAPAHSEVIGRISSSLNAYAYGYAINATIVQLIFASVSQFYLFGIAAAFIAWIPLISQFALNQMCLRRIIVNAKWKTLHGIQIQLKKLHNGSVKDKNQVDVILRLMDYHDRIRATPNSTLDFRAVINLSNQLALPSIGLVIANIEKIIAFFNS